VQEPGSVNAVPKVMRSIPPKIFGGDGVDPPEEAATSAAQTRLRPILMTSFAFILSVFPLAVATGAGSEMPQSLGTAVLLGMIGVTAFGLLFTPAFYTFVRKLGERRRHPRFSSYLQTEAK
jgi:Cu/Ag efflux pump CusA